MEDRTLLAISLVWGYLGPEARLHCFAQGLSTLPAPWPAALSTLRFFGDGRGAPSFSQPHPLSVQCPCLPRHHAQPLAAETQDPIDSLLFSATSHGRRGEGEPGGVASGGLSKPLMSWEVPDAKLRGCLVSVCSAWLLLSSTNPRTVSLSAQVDAQLVGRSVQKTERETKVEMVRGGRGPWCPLSALHTLSNALREDAALPLSSCPDRAPLCGASSVKGRQAGRDTALGIFSRELAPACSCTEA